MLLCTNIILIISYYVKAIPAALIVIEGFILKRQTLIGYII